MYTVLFVIFGILIGLLYLGLIAALAVFVLSSYKVRRKLYKKGFKKLCKFLDLCFRIIFSADVPSSVEIGKNCRFAHHYMGIVIHPRAKIGNNCKIFHNVTIGCRNGQGPPILGDNVYIGTGASVLGDVKIGNNVCVGANSVVLKDVPDNCVVVGTPAKIVKEQ